MKNIDRKDRDVVDAAGNKIGETNPDPITGEPGSHPVGTGIGAAGAGAVGAAIGAVAGPVGALAGAAIGAVVGGLAGHGIAEAIDPTAEDAYWREEFKRRPYVKPTHTYDDYAPAYRLGLDARVEQHRNPSRSFENIEGDLGSHWDNRRGDSRLAWDDAKHAVRDAWNRTDSHLSSLEASSRSMGSTSKTAGRDLNSGVQVGSGSNSDFDVDQYRTYFLSCPYYTPTSRFEDYEPAYRYGYEANKTHSGKSWDEIESDMERGWERFKGNSALTWERAKLAVRDGWNRMVHH